ncbi:hypothetical protein FOXYSP1_17703 [Fusarium oxysporum f. sp. phaseoli]
MSGRKPATGPKAIVKPPPPPPDTTDRGDFVGSEDEQEFYEVAEDPVHYSGGIFYPTYIGDALADRYRIEHKLGHVAGSHCGSINY